MLVTSEGLLNHEKSYRCGGIFRKVYRAISTELGAWYSLMRMLRCPAILVDQRDPESAASRVAEMLSCSTNEYCFRLQYRTDPR
jgi:hypothetical protein